MSGKYAAVYKMMAKNIKKKGYDKLEEYSREKIPGLKIPKYLSKPKKIQRIWDVATDVGNQDVLKKLEKEKDKLESKNDKALLYSVFKKCERERAIKNLKAINYIDMDKIERYEKRAKLVELYLSIAYSIDEWDDNNHLEILNHVNEMRQKGTAQIVKNNHKKYSKTNLLRMEEKNTTWLRPDQLEILKDDNNRKWEEYLHLHDKAEKKKAAKAHFNEGIVFGQAKFGKGKKSFTKHVSIKRTDKQLSLDENSAKPVILKAVNKDWWDRPDMYDVRGIDAPRLKKKKTTLN